MKIDELATRLKFPLYEPPGGLVNSFHVDQSAWAGLRNWVSKQTSHPYRYLVVGTYLYTRLENLEKRRIHAPKSPGRWLYLRAKKIPLPRDITTIFEGTTIEGWGCIPILA